ncbi:acyl-CoA dehydrogenase [Pseudomaricurvus alkylphenolicus]|uniref:acyl-CoA dehydrogenase family protein n=1 Tax=Pseudomaricurvus alkylphenolicus TaxID=1306991 RepID=UPI001420AECF|nr:acyl-CoA dehydrogenase family protein [Pseudomaricurvus alkylphenolicus]NIB38539.1 acyl-CoA dehydrogenase [Pseudomaricurvus alkylphenolicus]
MSQSNQEELDLFRDNVKRFIETEIKPNIEQWEREEITPRSLWHKLGQQGLLGICLPEEYGGAGADFRFSAAVLEEFHRANCATVGGNIAVHSEIVMHYILNHGSEKQKRDYLPRMISGECIGAIAMTEPGAGSDLQGIRMRAQAEDDHYRLNGSKTFITNGQHCDLVIVVARTRNGEPGSRSTTLFLVDTDTPGFERGRNLEKIGQHSSDTSELFFHDVCVSANAILGELDRGFSVLMGELQRERLIIGVNTVASAEGILDQTATYVKEREVFGKTLAELQNTKFKMAEMATEVRIHRAFVEECKTLLLAGQLDVATASMAKLSGSEMLGRVADGCLQLHGGYGYMREYDVARAFVDARVQRIYGGTSEIMKELISRAVLQ